MSLLWMPVVGVERAAEPSRIGCAMRLRTPPRAPAALGDSLGDVSSQWPGQPPKACASSSTAAVANEQPLSCGVSTTGPPADCALALTLTSLFSDTATPLSATTATSDDWKVLLPLMVGAPPAEDEGSLWGDSPFLHPQTAASSDEDGALLPLPLPRESDGAYAAVEMRETVRDLFFSLRGDADVDTSDAEANWAAGRSLSPDPQWTAVEMLMAQLTDDDDRVPLPAPVGPTAIDAALDYAPAAPTARWDRMRRRAPPAAIGEAPEPSRAVRGAGRVAHVPLHSVSVVDRAALSDIHRCTPQAQCVRATINASCAGAGSLTTALGWPPQSKSGVVSLLERLRACELLRHLRIVSFSRRNPQSVMQLFESWCSKGIRPPDVLFGAYYRYVMAKNEKELCLKHNGRGRMAGHGRGCDFASKGPYFRCRYHHACLFCRAPDHGWFDEEHCERYAELQREMLELGVTDSVAVVLLDALEQDDS